MNFLENTNLPNYKTHGKLKFNFHFHLTAFTEKIYPNISQNWGTSASWLKERAILISTNDLIVTINNALLEKLPTNMIMYKSIDSMIEFEDTIPYSVEVLLTLDLSDTLPCVLYLKIGVPIMVLCNLNPSKFLNGTTCCRWRLYTHVIEATIFTGAR